MDRRTKSEPRKLWNSTLRRSKPLKQSGFSKKPVKALKRTPLKQIGKKGRANAKANKVIDAELAKNDIRHCEAQLSPCVGSIMLTRAHSKKRRNIVGDEITEAIYACIPCHNIIEAWPEPRMTAFVREKISAREKQSSI